MKTSDSDLKVNRNIYPDAVTCDRTFSHSDECRTKKLIVCEKNVAAFSCCGKVL